MALTPVSQLDIDTFVADMSTVYNSPALFLNRVNQVLLDDNELQLLQAELGNTLTTLDLFRNLVMLASIYYANVTTTRAMNAEIQSRQVIQNVVNDRQRVVAQYHGLVQRINTALSYHE